MTLAGCHLTLEPHSLYLSLLFRLPLSQHIHTAQRCRRPFLKLTHSPVHSLPAPRSLQD